MSVTRGREAAFFFSNYRIRVLRFLYGTLLSAYDQLVELVRICLFISLSKFGHKKKNPFRGPKPTH